MNKYEKMLFNTDDWLARNPKVLWFLIILFTLIISSF